MSAARDAKANRQVDLAHHLAAQQPDCVMYLRSEQTAAEQRYAETGDPDDLAMAQAFERSLGTQQ